MQGVDHPINAIRQSRALRLELRDPPLRSLELCP